MGREDDVAADDLSAHKEVANQHAADGAPAPPSIENNYGSLASEVGEDQKIDEDKTNNAAGALKDSTSKFCNESNIGEDHSGNFSPQCRSGISSEEYAPIRGRRDWKNGTPEKNRLSCRICRNPVIAVRFRSIEM